MRNYREWDFSCFMMDIVLFIAICILIVIVVSIALSFTVDMLNEFVMPTMGSGKCSLGMIVGILVFFGSLLTAVLLWFKK